LEDKLGAIDENEEGRVNKNIYELNHNR